MKRHGFVETDLGRVAFDLINPTSAREYEVRLTSGVVGMFLLGRVRFNEDGNEACLTLSKTLGVIETTVSQDPDNPTMEALVERAIDRWHELAGARNTNGRFGGQRNA